MQCPDPFPGLVGGQDFQQDEKNPKTQTSSQSC